MAVTKEQIFSAADELAAAGQKPTLEAIRQRTGGSYTTISPALNEWKARQATAAAPLREPAPQAVADRCRQAGALVLVNDDGALARRIGADGLHLPASRLAELDGRPAFEWVGASCHTRAELERAAALGLDYALLGAVKTTPSHPERAALGWKAFAEMAGRLPMPVFALGGLGADDLCDAKAAGAHGIAAIRAVWKD